MRAWIGVALIGLTGLGGGCARRPAPPEDLSVRDFRAPRSSPRPVSAEPAPPALRQDHGFAPALGPAGAAQIAARPGTPEAPDLAPGDTGGEAPAVIVDEIVGSINAKPIYAAEFLSTMGLRMRAEAEQYTPAEWRERSRQGIEVVLRARIENELIRSESLARLRPAERQGLISFLDDLTRRDRSMNRGSEALVERRLREENSSLGDEWQQKREQLLIDLRRREWRRQVVVSADEVDLYYERNRAEFNARATFRRIRVLADDEAAIARITTALEEDVPFATVAADEANLHNPDKGGLVEDVGAFSGPYEQATFFVGPLNVAAVSMQPGAWAGPVSTGNSVSWLHLERLQPAMTLFEARPRIRAVLEDQRLREIAQADILRLMAQSSVTDVGKMTDRLLAIAEQWYLQPVLAARRGRP